MRVLLVEDSSTVVAYVRSVLAAEPDVELLSPAGDGASAVERVRRERPDVVLMDLELPVMDGLTATEEIMCSAPCPIVVLSARLDVPGRDRAFEALEAGAVDVLAKPRGVAPDEIEHFRRTLIRTLRVMAEAKLITRRRRSAPLPLPAPAWSEPCEAVVLGSSTGGPVLLYEILAALTPPYALPILIAQHIVPGFEEGFAAWLARTGHDVRVVSGAVPIAPGRVYVAPADADLRIVGPVACRSTSTSFVRPSIDVLFATAAERYGPRLAALLLTGMGTDGALGLGEVHRRGGLTVTQRADTCVVDGMAGAARRAGASQHDLAPREIVALLRRLSARWSCAPRSFG